LSTANDSSDIISDTPLATGAVVQGRYQIVRKLGRGGMGAVYEAVDRRLGITVALKETLSAEPSMRKQFEREARLLASLQHAALPRVTDHFVEGNRAFLVMQFIAGVDLARIISQQPGPFPRDQVIAWADQLLDALIYLHSHDRQVIHRDIKPHNLKLTASGQIALLDFGLAKASSVDTSVTASRAFFGYTRQYAPLEQIEDRRTDQRSDIYALGATLYHLLTGIKPQDALVRAAAAINSEPDPLQPANKIYAAVGPQVAAILAKAMALRPEERYANASDFREALRCIGRTIPPVKIKVSENPKVDNGDTTVFRYRESIGPQLAMVESQRRFGPALAAAVVVAMLCAVAVPLLYQSRDRGTAMRDAAAPADAVNKQSPSVSRKGDRVGIANGAATNSKKEVNGRQSAKAIADDDKKQVVSANPRIPSAVKPITIRVQQQLSADRKSTRLNSSHQI